MNTRGVLEKKYLIHRELTIRKAQSSFWNYCTLKLPKVYNENRPHLKKLILTLQDFYNNQLINDQTQQPFKNLMINIPPRHAKTLTILLFSQWVYGQNQNEKIISVSYNEKLSNRFSRSVRDGISETKAEPHRIIYNDIFPEVKIKDGDGSQQIWSLEGSHFSYLGTSFNATITGIGCTIGIIDDPIKNAEEAFNDNVLESQWDWYRNTFLSRLEEGARQIVVMTRWVKNDLCGRLLETETEKWYKLSLPAYDQDGNKMLCPEMLSYETYKDRERKTSQEIFQANYNQNPIDKTGSLYSEFKTYLPSEVPRFEKIISYTDTADTGTDWLCSIVAGIYRGRAYVLDLIYSQESMEKTELQTAKLFYETNTETALIESNNGGRGFARNVERILWDNFRSRNTKIFWFHQIENKKARILTNASYAQNNIFFPSGWEKLYPEFYRDIIGFKRKGNNKYDDCADALSGLTEYLRKINEKAERKIRRSINRNLKNKNKDRKKIDENYILEARELILKNMK